MNSRTRLSAVSHGLYTFAVIILALLSTYGIFYDLPHLHIWQDFVSIGVEALFNLALWCIVYFEIRSFGSKLFIDDNGIGIKRFRKTKVFLSWSDICETGIGFIPTPVGNKKRLYLSAKHLTDDQKHDLMTLKYETVYFSYLPNGWAEIISEKCADADFRALKEWEKSL